MQPARALNSLALVFQEALTAIERIRAGREKVGDADGFRTEIRHQFITANEEGRKCGYSREDAGLAMFAVIALLDESILNSRNPVFADWPRRPLQQEVFGGHQAGEVFFQNIERAMQQPDSSVLADILEVYLLCILLGYVGRYSVTGKSELRSLADTMAERIRRIRGVSCLAPGWAPQGGITASAPGDPWVRWLSIAAVGLGALAAILFTVFKITLGSGVSGLS